MTNMPRLAALPHLEVKLGKSILQHTPPIQSPDRYLDKTPLTIIQITTSKQYNSR